MDKDEHFKSVLDNLCSCSLDQFFDSNNFKEELMLINSSEEQDNQSDSHENNQLKDSNLKQSDLEKAAILKNYSAFLEEQIYSQETLRENEDNKIEFIVQYLNKIIGSEEKYFSRKVNLFSKITSSYYINKKSVNKLEFNYDPLLLEYSLMPNFSIKSLPGMKPLSTWPISLGDLWDKLKTVKLEELFNQPIEEKFKETFYDEALEQISNFDKENDMENLTKAVSCFLCVLILFGDYLLLFKGIINLKVNLKNKNSLDESIFKEEGNPLILKIKDLFNFLNENDFNLYPIMRNYSLVDYFTINKSFLYSQTKSTYYNSCCCCSDGTYLYIFMSGIDGCKLKIGTGFNNTVKGRVYLCVQNKEESGSENSGSYGNQWVYCNGKIYQKVNRVSTSFESNIILDYKNNIGILNVINPENFKIENRIRLLFPQNALNELIIYRNQNYALLSDGQKLNIICLELIKDNKKVVNNKEKKPNPNDKDDQLIYKYINLEMIEYDTKNLNYNTQEYQSKISPQNKKLIDEIYLSFSQIFTKEECFKALLKNNWNPKETALYLIDNPSEIKQSLLIGEKPVILFQSKIESQNIKSGGKCEFKFYNNTYFDCYHYDSFKWVLDEKFVMAYRLSEGAVAIFGRDPEKFGKLFNYEIEIKKPIINNFSFPTFIGSKSKPFPKTQKNYDAKDNLGMAIKTQYDLLKKYIEQGHEDKLLDEFDKDFIGLLEIESNLFKKAEFKSNEINKKEEENKEEKNNENAEDKIVDEIFGTLIKKTSSISLNKNNYILTYDIVNKVYYIMINAVVNMNSFSILVSDTFDNMNNEYKRLFNLEGENLLKTKNFFNSLAIDKNKENKKVSFDQLTNELLNIIYLGTSSMKFDIFWRYSNWSFYYNYLLEFMNNRYQEANNNIEPNLYLLPISKQYPISKKSLTKRVDKFNDYNKELLVMQLDKELNENYKLKDIPEIESTRKYSMYNASPNKKNLGNWMSGTSLMFKYNYLKDKKGHVKLEEKVDESVKEFVMRYIDKKIYLTNKRIFFLSMKGDYNEINYLLELLAKKKENDNYLDFIPFELLFKLIYIWISNIDNTLILTNKAEFQKAINDLNLILKEYYNDSNTDIKIKNLIKLIIIEGWNELAISIEDQIFWFKDFYNFNKSTDKEEEILSKNDLNLECFTLLYYEKYPFYCLLKKLDYTRNSLCINNNFNKINIVKVFNFYPILYKKKYRLVAIPSFHGFSSINIQIPFYWILFNFDINYFQKEAKEVVKPIAIDVDYKKSERFSPPYKGVVVDYKISKINKILHEKIHLKSSLVIYYEFINNEEIKINNESINKEMWEFFNSNFKDNRLINLVNKLFILCLGEINVLYKNYSNMMSSYINSSEGATLLSKFKDYVLSTGSNKRDSFSKININQEKENVEEDNKAEIKEKFKENYIAFFNDLQGKIENYLNLNENINDNYELLKLNVNYLYFIFQGIKTYIFNKDKSNLKLLLSSLKKLNNYESNAISLNNELGNIYSNSRVFEYNLSESELVNINQTISFNNNNELFCIELELQITNNEKLPNKDLLIVSDYHGYKNINYYMNNYVNSFGTSFNIKLNRSFKKIIFLKGTEIKIASPSDCIKNQVSNGNENSKTTSENYLNQFSNKSVLRIKVYSYNNHSLKMLNKEKDTKLTEKRIKNISLSIVSIEEIEYYLSYIFKNIIKSTDIDKTENENILTKYDILKLGLKDEFYKTIDELYEKEKNNYKKNTKDGNKIEFIKTFLEKDKTILTSLKNSNVDADLYIFKLILKRIRKVSREPITYINIKKFPSFNKEIKDLWEKVEILLLYSFLYHLNLINDFKDVVNNNDNDVVDNALELILGKRLNIIMSFISNKALLYKDSFDLIKNFLYDFEDEFNKLYEEIKQIIIKDIYNVSLQKEEDKLPEKEDTKEGAKEAKPAEKKEKKKKDKLAELKEKFGSKDDTNYKKKKNAPRTLYQEKKKKKKKNTEKEKNNEEEEKLKKRNEEEEKYNNLNAKTLEQLINESPNKITDEINEKVKVIKNLLTNKYKDLIKEEINLRYFGNKETLKSICELYKIDYNDNNPNESMDKYSSYIYNEIYDLVKDNNFLNKIIIDDKLLNKKNPFIYIADEMIHKISLLINLNNYNENNENEEFNLQLTERMKSFNNSFNLALHSNNSSSLQNISSNKNINVSPDENYVLDPKMQYILKSLVHYIIKFNDNVNKAIAILYTQYIRSKTRILGICNLSDYLKKDLNCYTNYNYGLLSLAVGKYKNGLLNNIESNNRVMNDIKNELITLLEKNINTLLNIIKEYENENTNANDISNNKVVINLSKTAIDNEYNKNHEENNTFYYLVKKIILILSDIHIVLKYMSSHKHLFEEDLAKINLENFIELIFGILMNDKKLNSTSNYNDGVEKIKKLIKEIIKIILDEIILLNSQKNTDCIFGHLYDNLCLSKEKSNKKNILELIRNILLNYNKVSQNNQNINYNSDSNIIKISSKLLEFIESSNIPEIINISSHIIIYIYKSISQKGKKEINNLLSKDTEVLFKKIGKLFMFDENHKLLNNNENINSLEISDDKSDNYLILVEMNSTEFDYQFLVNALFYWEEKYPTELSKYKYETDDKEKEKEKGKDKDNEKEKKEGESDTKKEEKKTEYNPSITVENKYNVKLFNYFNIYKAEKGRVIYKMTKLYRIVDDKIDSTVKNIDLLEKSLKDSKTKAEDKEKITEKIKKLKKNQKYYYRIKAHIKLAEEIGEIASIKGYVILLPKLSHKKAMELCELLYKANNRLLKHFTSEIDNNETLFNDQLLFPPLPNKTNLLAGLTTTLMETTKSNLNFTLITEKEYDVISETYDYFSKEIKKNSVLEKKQEKFGKYHDNWMLGSSKIVINSINYNSYYKKIIEEENILTGKCVTIIIQSIIELLYNIYELNSSIIIKLVRSKLKQIKSDFNFKDSTEENSKIIGMLLYINNYYNIIRQNTKVTNSNAKDNESKVIGKVISGGDKSGSNICKVCFANKNISSSKSGNYSNMKSSHNRTSFNNNNTGDDLTGRVIFRIENVNVNSLNKLDENEDLIKCIPLSEIFDIFISSYENYKDCKQLDNQILLQLSLKLLNNKKMEKSELARFCESNKNIVNKALDYLQEISNMANWIEKKDKFWESEFIESFERLQNKFNIDKKNLIGIYSPIFVKIQSNEKDAEKEDKEKKDSKDKTKNDKKEDLITGYNMSQSDFITELPILKDYSKITSSMRNIIIFERYFVGEIYNYCKQQYLENDYITSLSQIRYQISIADLNGLKNDMSAVFDNGKIPITGPLFREQFDTNEIFTQEIYPNNYYCARINKMDTPVLVLLQDYTIGYCLCLIFDDYKGKMFTQWINNEDLKLLTNPIKIPSFSFSLKELIKEYNYLEKKLRILYSKNALSDIILALNTIEYDIPLKDNNNLFELQLNNWKKFKLNPTSGVFKDLNNYISMKNSQKVQKLLSSVKNDQKNLDDLINKSLLGFDNNEENKKIINNNENKINEDKNNNEFIKKWVMNEWENLGKNLKTITVNLYKDYIEKSYLLSNSSKGENLYHLSNFNNKLLALHELIKLESDIDTSNICGILITFKEKTALEACAKLTFYSDPYGENVIGEITSFKTITSNLPTYIFNYPKVWLKYTPGTRCFYIYEWSTVALGSDLPCLITAIPCNWPLLIQLTDTITDDLFSEDNSTSNNIVEEYKKLIHLLINHCSTNYIPSEIQKRIFNITTRTLFKYKQYLKINGDGNDENIEKKIDLISTDKGKDLVDLIKKIEKTVENKNNNEVNNKYCSSYVVEGVEIILAILSIIKGPKIDIGIISNYLKDKFNYILPIFIITIDKLNHLIDFINNSNENSLEKSLNEEMMKESDLTNFLFNNILILKIKDDFYKVEEPEKKEEDKKEDAKKEEVKKEEDKKEEDKKEGDKKDQAKKEENKKVENKDKKKNDKKNAKKEENKDKKGKKESLKKEKENIPKKLSLKETVIQILREHEVIIVNSDDDIFEFDYNNEGKMEKYLGIAFDGFILSDKNLKTEEEKHEEEKVVEEEDPLWTCFYCKNDNDKSNSFCVFCDKDKKVLPKEKPKPKEPEQQNELGPPINYDMVLRYNEKKMKNLLKKLSKIEKEPFDKLYYGEELISLPDYPGPLNNYLYERIIKYRTNKDYYLPKLSNLKKINNPSVNEILNQLSCDNELKCENILDIIMNCLNAGIDFWFEYTDIKDLLNNKQNNGNIDLQLLTKICNIIDNSIISNQVYNKIEDYVLFFPSNQIRCIYPTFSNFNQISSFKDLNEIPLNVIRYYWSIIKYYNNCLKTSLPYIKPPSPYKTILKNSTKSDYILVPLHETISTFLTNTRGLIFNSIKIGLLNSIINSSEFNEEEIQIPEMKFERLEIASNIDKKKNEVVKMIANNINYTEVIDEQRIDNINIKNLLKNNLNEKDSLFLQAFNQYKYYDISSYRAKKFPGDPKVAFKVIFKNEFVQGLGGPYRQFFSDISKELNDYLPLIIETQNNLNNKGEFKDCYTINPSYNGINALDQYEFLGVLMGICIRTGVHLTLDLCSLVWKQIVNEKITLDDIFQYDEGTYNIIKTIYYYDQNKEKEKEKESEKDKEKNEINTDNNNDSDNNPINKEKEEIENVFNYNTILSDGSVKYFNPNTKEKKELILDKSTPSERIKYIRMLIYNRINEAEIQINSIKNGLSKIIPLSVLQLFTGKELSLLVCGKKEVDIDLLHQNTKLSNDLKEDSKEVRWLWEILHEMNSEEKIKFIKFCWAQERLPTSNEEYVKNQIVFTIKYNKNERNKNGFPKADTCFFNLELPNYTAKDIMKKNLLIAIGLDNNSMNADKITGINSGYISTSQRGNNRDDDDRDYDYENYDGNYPMESCDEEGYMT